MKDGEYELMDAPSGDNPLKDEVIRRMAFVQDLSDALLGTSMPMKAMPVILRMLEGVEDPDDGEWMPIMVGMEPVAVCAYDASADGWKITPLLRRRPEMSFEAAVLDITATMLADEHRTIDAEQRWPKP